MIYKEIETVIGRVYVLDVLSLTLEQSLNSTSFWSRREEISEEIVRCLPGEPDLFTVFCAAFYSIPVSFLSGYLPELINM